jgi:hypothetical protein
MITKLWDVEHPYHSSECNYYSNDQTFDYNDWDSFFEEWGKADPDYNLVFRFDWLEPEDNPRGNSHTLHIFWIQQRKGIYCATLIHHVEPDREPEIREWLQRRYKHMQKLWTPFSNPDDLDIDDPESEL